MKNTLIKSAIWAMPVALMFPAATAQGEDWWFEQVVLDPGESFHFHHEDITWHALWAWITIEAQSDMYISFHDTTIIDGVEEVYWEDFVLYEGNIWEYHDHYEYVQYTGEWLWIENIGNYTIEFDLHITKTPSPATLSLLACGGLVATRRRR